MEERVDHQIAVVAAKPTDAAPVTRRAQRLGVGAHDSLGGACGPRGEQQVAEVIGAQRGDTLVERVLRDAGSRGEELLEAHRPARNVAPQHDDPMEVGQIRRGGAEHAHVVVAEESLDGEEDLGPAGPEDVCGLGPLVAGVEGDEHAPGGLEPQRGNRPLPDVGRPDRDTVTRLDAGTDERLGHLGNLLVQLRVGEGHLSIDDRGVIAVGLRRGAHQHRCGSPLEVATDQIGFRHPSPQSVAGEI